MTTKIIGTGSCFPERIVSNDELAGIVETNDEWISTRTGISERRISIGQDTSDLASEAALRAIENAGIEPDRLELIIVATSSPDSMFPNTASLVQKNIAAHNAACFDISAACTGFLVALDTAHAFIKSGIYKNALVIGAEVMSKTIDWSDRNTCVLFGDGAGAAIVEAGSVGIEDMVMHSDGGGGNVLTAGSRSPQNFLINENEKTEQYSWLKMDGQEVFMFAVRKVPECIAEVLERNSLKVDDVDHFLLHQANKRIIQSVAKRLGVDMDRFPINLDRYGNTSAATIPALLDEMNRAGQLNVGDRIILSGFGGGLSWGATLLTWTGSNTDGM